MYSVENIPTTAEVSSAYWYFTVSVTTQHNNQAAPKSPKIDRSTRSMSRMTPSPSHQRHLAKSCILKSSPKFTCYTTNTVSDVYLFSLVLTQFTYFPQDVSETHTSLHSTELQLILRYEAEICLLLAFLPCCCSTHKHGMRCWRSL